MLMGIYWEQHFGIKFGCFLKKKKAPNWDPSKHPSQAEQAVIYTHATIKGPAPVTGISLKIKTLSTCSRKKGQYHDSVYTKFEKMQDTYSDKKQMSGTGQGRSGTNRVKREP